MTCVQALRAPTLVACTVIAYASVTSSASAGGAPEAPALATEASGIDGAVPPPTEANATDKTASDTNASGPEAAGETEHEEGAEKGNATAAGMPPIMARAAWKAADADESLMRRHSPRAIIVHHTDTAQSRKRPLETKLKNLQSFSMNPGTISGTGKKKPAWGDVPYHYYIDVSGRIGEGRSLAFAGDTNTGYKTDGYIQIVVEGKFDSETPDPKQIAALDRLVLALARTYKVAAKDITGHNDHAPSDCPGKKLKAHLPELRGLVEATAAQR